MKINKCRLKWCWFRPSVKLRVSRTRSLDFTRPPHTHQSKDIPRGKKLPPCAIEKERMEQERTDNFPKLEREEGQRTFTKCMWDRWKLEKQKAERPRGRSLTAPAAGLPRGWRRKNPYQGTVGSAVLGAELRRAGCSLGRSSDTKGRDIKPTVPQVARKNLRNVKRQAAKLT